MTEVWNGSVGERLLKLRNQKGMTQEDLAEYLNVSRQSVSKWELNKTLPDVEKLMQLSDLYEVTLDYIVKGVEKQTEGKDETSDDRSEDMETEGNLLGELEEGQNADISETEEWKNNIFIQSAFELTVHRIIFLVAMLVSGVIFVCSVFFSVRLVGNHTFTMDGKEQDVAYVDQVYEQYTLADVQIMDENSNFVNKKVWLDVNGVREGDYIGYYYDEGESSDIHFMYYAKSLIVPFIVVVLSLIFTIICWMGFRSYGGRKK
ncbi:MAG: helix-turn-helix transcriptional regulator [Lachnospiraceae bacterium]|nr:helix-turn-helix transcriptional regulator [Lachnospiraceae bacterium]